ncbi:hypothetical protein GOBAR_DD17765 [Gossypium barbadense]|nr:hypothetical protein GOBAR_DD17765 [Gossypium barbadense]
MAYASHIINHSKRLRNVPKLLRYDHAVLVRWFSNGAQSSVCKREDVAKIRPLGYAPAERETVSKFVGSHPVSYCLSKKTLSRTVMRSGIPMGGVVYSRGLLWNLIPVSVFSSQALSRRRFASDAGLPPCQEIGMPSLSPTMTEGNIARWLKKEGDKVSPGEVLCEVETSFPCHVASRGKEVSAPTPKTKDAKLAALDYVDIPHSQIRKVTASRLLFSKQTIPHYYLTVDTCVDKLMDLRSQLNSLQEASGGKRISVNDLVIKAAALALRKVPQCNSSWTDDYIRQYNNVNINVAVQTDNGLYVPVIRDADKKGLSSIAEEVKNLAQKAKENSLKPEDYEGGTFTVSNLGGPFGIKQFCAIINPPQSGILAVGSAEKRVIPGSGPDQFKFASFMSVTLSCDHRVIDGAIGAEWLKAFKGYIENPESMLL